MSIAIAREQRRKERKKGRGNNENSSTNKRVKNVITLQRRTRVFSLQLYLLSLTREFRPILPVYKLGQTRFRSTSLSSSCLFTFLSFHRFFLLYIIICRLSSNQVRIEILHGGSSDEEQRQSCTTLMMFTSICADKFLTTHIFSELLSLFPLFLLHLFGRISFIFSVCVYQFIFQAIFWVFLYSIDF